MVREFATRLHLKQFNRYLSRISDNGILEVGCNHGYLLAALETVSEHIYGIDIDASVLMNPEHRHSITCACDAQAIAFADKSFELIIALHTIEHIPDLIKAITELSRVLKPSGTLILVYPFEPVIGMTCIPGISLSSKGNKHLHTLHPKALLKMLNTYNVALCHIDSWLYYGLLPNYITILEKCS